MIIVGDKVKVLSSCDGKNSVQFERGIVLYKNLVPRCVVQFDKNVCGHNGNGIGKDRYCWMVEEEMLRKES